MSLRAAITIHWFEQSVPASMRIIKLCVDIWTLWSHEAPLSKDTGAKRSLQRTKELHRGSSSPRFPLRSQELPSPK